MLCYKFWYVLPKSKTCLLLKSGALDNTGCRGDEVCLPKGDTCPAESFDERGCPIHEEFSCAADQELCEGLWQSNGCQLKATCIPKHSECSCPAQTYDKDGCPVTVPNPTCDGDTQACAKSELWW